MNGFGKTLLYLRKRENLTQAELGKSLGISKSAVSMYETGNREPDFETLEAIADYFNVNMGFLVGGNLPSNIIPYTQGRKIPVVGYIAAGIPILAEENIEGYDYADVPEAGEYFFLRVRGDSMINANILDGSLVLIKQQPCADNGQIVACIVNGDEATLKRFYQKKDTIILQPENPAYEPILLSYKEFENGYAHILGIAIEVKTKL